MIQRLVPSSALCLGLILLFSAKTLDAQLTIRVSLASDGSQANGHSLSPSISADGRFVAFASLASNLVPGDTPGTNDVFLYNRETGQIQRIATGMGNSGVLGTSLSADGRFLAYTYAAPVSGVYQVYVYDRITGLTECASVAMNG
jgi:Tol biopolymer transport system component